MYTGIDELGHEKSNTLLFMVEVGASNFGLKVFLIFLIIVLSFLICWRYRYNLFDTWDRFRGKPIGMPAHAYAHLPTHTERVEVKPFSRIRKTLFGKKFIWCVEHTVLQSGAFVQQNKN